MKLTRKLLALALVLVMVMTLSISAMAAEQEVYVLDATQDLEAMEAGAKADGDTLEVKDYFTIIFKAKTKIDGSNKEFEDGYTATQRLNFGGKTEPNKGMIGSVRFTTSGPATIKLWWVAGDADRYFAIYNENLEEIAKTDLGGEKNALHMSELKVDAAGTYYIGVPVGSNYLFKAEVAVTPETPAPTGDAIAPIFVLMAVSAAALLVLGKKKLF